MKTIQCAHPPHHHNGFVATYRLCTASGRPVTTFKNMVVEFAGGCFVAAVI